MSVHTVSDEALFFEGFSDEAIWSGFSSQQLDEICSRTGAKTSLGWISWTSELYGGGEGFRTWLGWPAWLPLPVASDHGIDTTGIIGPDDLKSIGRLPYLSAHPETVRVLRERGINAYLAPSPWLYLIQRWGARVSDAARGRVLFFPHSIPGHEPTCCYIEDFIEFTKLQRKECHPVVVCLHMHDVKAGVHRELQAAGLAVVSAGNTSHPEFFRRWIRIMSAFRSGVSPLPGSEAVMFAAMGGNFGKRGPYRSPRDYLLKRLPEKGFDPASVESEVEAALRRYDDKFALFPYPPATTSEQMAYVESLSNPLGGSTPQTVRRAAMLALIPALLRILAVKATRAGRAIRSTPPAG